MVPPVSVNSTPQLLLVVYEHYTPTTHHDRLLCIIGCIFTYVCTCSRVLVLVRSAVIRNAPSWYSQPLSQIVQIVEHMLYSTVNTSCAALCLRCVLSALRTAMAPFAAQHFSQTQAMQLCRATTHTQQTKRTYGWELPL